MKMNLLPWELLCLVQMGFLQLRGKIKIRHNHYYKTKTSNWLLLEKGIRIVVLTLGSASDGVFLCTKGGSSFMRIGLERIKPSGPCGKFYKIVTSSFHPHWFGTTDLERDSHHFVVYFPSISCVCEAHRGW